MNSSKALAASQAEIADGFRQVDDGLTVGARGVHLSIEEATQTGVDVAAHRGQKDAERIRFH